MQLRDFNKVALGSVLGLLLPSREPFVATFEPTPAGDVQRFRIAAWSQDTLFWTPASKPALSEDHTSVVFTAAPIVLNSGIYMTGCCLVNDLDEIIGSRPFNQGIVGCCPGDILKITYSLDTDPGVPFEDWRRGIRERPAVPLRTVRDAIRFSHSDASLSPRDYQVLRELLA